MRKKKKGKKENSFIYSSSIRYRDKEKWLWQYGDNNNNMK